MLSIYSGHFSLKESRKIHNDSLVKLRWYINQYRTLLKRPTLTHDVQAHWSIQKQNLPWYDKNFRSTKFQWKDNFFVLIVSCDYSVLFQCDLLQWHHGFSNMPKNSFLKPQRYDQESLWRYCIIAVYFLHVHIALWRDDRKPPLNKNTFF